MKTLQNFTFFVAFVVNAATGFQASSGAAGVEFDRLLHAFAPGFGQCGGTPICRDSLTPAQLQLPAGQTGAPAAGNWRLIRTPGPSADKDIVSIIHTADMLRSDPDFVGLMIRCQTNARLQVALVVARPFPPRARPQITIKHGQSAVDFQADVLPAGSALSLPDSAEALAKGPWQALRELSFRIQGDGVTIDGIVAIDHLAAALGILESSCPVQKR
jgi:hypothetical protein